MATKERPISPDERRARLQEMRSRTVPPITPNQLAARGQRSREILQRRVRGVIAIATQPRSEKDPAIQICSQPGDIISTYGVIYRGDKWTFDRSAVMYGGEIVSYTSVLTEQKQITTTKVDRFGNETVAIASIDTITPPMAAVYAPLPPALTDERARALEMVDRE